MAVGSGEVGVDNAHRNSERSVEGLDSDVIVYGGGIVVMFGGGGVACALLARPAMCWSISGVECAAEVSRRWKHCSASS